MNKQVKLLVCGSRGKFKDYEKIVFEKLDNNRFFIEEIIEGCCPNSADNFAENWASKNHILLNHFPATPRNYLKRNIDMVETCDLVFAFWDNYSYGTAHTIATAIRLGKNIDVIDLKKAKK